MPNYVHRILVPADASGLRDALTKAHRGYTRMINFREGWQGQVWQERFHSFVVDEQHLLAAARYVERNPGRARLVATPQDRPGRALRRIWRERMMRLWACARFWS
jgi:putative transposase